MNKNGFFKCICLILIGCCACSNASKRNSSGILPIDSVAIIVADCYFTEGEIYVNQWKFDMKNYTVVKYDSLFNKYGITKKMLVKNVEYYITHPKQREKFIGKVDKIVEQRVAALRDSLELEH